MTDADVVELVLEARRIGAIYGLLLGVLGWLVIRECVHEFRYWRLSLKRQRQIRCIKDWK